MPSDTKHVGMPESCPACLLPEDQFARREAVWEHALAQFADQSGVDVSSLPSSDLVPMVRSWAMAGAVARMDRELFADELASRAARAEARSERWAVRLAAFLMLAVLVCLGIVCSGVWRFLT